MTQYPEEKDARPGQWAYPGQEGTYPSHPYTTHDGAPPPAPMQNCGPSQYQAAPPPQGPPPDYGYALSHPDGRSAYDHQGPNLQQTAYHPPPGAGPYGMQAGSSLPPQGDGHGDTTMSLGSFFGNKGPPTMWQRQAPTHLPYNAFPPMCLISNGSELTKGFPELPPPCRMNPHPFATHDVTEEDWKRFLADVKRAASLSPAQRIKSNVIPMVAGMGFFGGFIATAAIERKMKRKNRGAAGDVVDHWNHYFFVPRRMEVVLCQASERLSGKLGTAPVGDPEQERMADRLRQRTESSSSSSSESEDGDRHGQTRRAARRERRQRRREAKQERRARKARGDDRRPYELYITAL